MFGGQAEYQTIAAVKAAVRIPVIANGDVDAPEKAREVLDATGADGLMIGRAALGNPWIFREVGHFLTAGQTLARPDVAEVRRVLLAHLDDLYTFYGERTGVSLARKHIGWYTRGLPRFRRLPSPGLPNPHRGRAARRRGPVLRDPWADRDPAPVAGPGCLSLPVRGPRTPRVASTELCGYSPSGQSLDKTWTNSIASGSTSVDLGGTQHARDVPGVCRAGGRGGRCRDPCQRNTGRGRSPPRLLW